MGVIKIKDHITASPLTWPAGWDRSAYEESSRFSRNNKKVSIGYASDFILHELELMSVPYYDVIISSDLRLRQDGFPISNQRNPDDVGVSVWWMKGKTQQVIALDKYDRIADNMYAIGKTLEAMRGIERWGGGEILNRTFTGFVALPDNSIDWRSVLGHANNLEEAKNLYKRHRSASHPDNGGSPEAFIACRKAWEEAQNEFCENA